jgi:hypothetical protein
MQPAGREFDRPNLHVSAHSDQRCLLLAICPYVGRELVKEVGTYSWYVCFEQLIHVDYTRK